MADFPSFCFVSALFQDGPERNDTFDEDSTVSLLAGPHTNDFILLKGKYFKGT